MHGYYATSGPFTDLDGVGGLPDACDTASLAEFVQGLLIHADLAVYSGVNLSPERVADKQIRGVRSMLERVVQLDDRPLTEARPPERRMAAVCQHFATLHTALLRRGGGPGRGRGRVRGFLVPGQAGG